MKKIPTHISPIFLWQRADHVDTMRTEVGIVDIFEYEGETFYLFKNGVVCYEEEVDYHIDCIRDEENYPEDDFTFTPYIRSNA